MDELPLLEVISLEADSPLTATGGHSSPLPGCLNERPLTPFASRKWTGGFPPQTAMPAPARLSERTSAYAVRFPKADGRLSTKNGLSASKFRALAPPLYRARVSRA